MGVVLNRRTHTDIVTVIDHAHDSNVHSSAGYPARPFQLTPQRGPGPFLPGLLASILRERVLPT